MPVFIELITEAFEETNARIQKDAGSGSGSARAGKSNVRRPVRGLEIKEDTFAFLKVVRADNTEIPIIDSSSPTGKSEGGYSNFILQSVQEARMEKNQIVETFGDSYIFFFGESPRFLDVSAVLLNSNDFNWEAEWWENYNKYLRGTKLVEMGARCYLFYDDNIVEGYILGAQAAKTADTPLSVQLTFKFFVTNQSNVSFIGDTNFPTRKVLTTIDIDEAAPIDSVNTDSQQIASNAVSTRSAADQAAVDALLSLNEQLLGAIGPPTDLKPDEIEAANAAIAKNLAAIQNFPPGQFGSDRALSDAVRNAPPGGLTDPAVTSAIQSTKNSGPGHRGKIYDNFDEYIDSSDGAGTSTGLSYRLQDDRPPLFLLQGIVDSITNADDDLQTEAANQMANYVEPAPPTPEPPPEEESFGKKLQHFLARDTPTNSRDVLGSPKVMNGLGVGPIFTAGAGAGAVAGFGPRFGGAAQGFGGGIGGSAGAFAVASSSGRAFAGAFAGAAAGVGVVTTADGTSLVSTKSSFAGIFGPTAAAKNVFSSDRFRYVEGVNDPRYGYRSPHAAGPGFGVVGFADYGGPGFGGCSSTGDPGFRDPRLFAFAGVGASARAGIAYTSFNRPNQDITALGGSAGVFAVAGVSTGSGAFASSGTYTRTGLGGGTSGQMGGAYTTVTGRPSAFAMVSVPGKLDPTGQASSGSFSGVDGSGAYAGAWAQASFP